MPCLLDHRCQLRQDVHLGCRIYLPPPCTCGTASAAGLIFWSQTLAANVSLGILKTKIKYWRKVRLRISWLCVLWYKRKAAWRGILAAPGDGRWGSLLAEGADQLWAHKTHQNRGTKRLRLIWDVKTPRNSLTLEIQGCCFHTVL